MRLMLALRPDGHMFHQVTRVEQSASPPVSLMLMLSMRPQWPHVPPGDRSFSFVPPSAMGGGLFLNAAWLP